MTQDERIDILEETVRQLRDQLVPVFPFPWEWNLNRGEAKVLACLYASPNGFRTHEQLFAASERPGHVGKGSVGTRVYALRNKLEPLGIRILTRHGEGFELPRESREIIADLFC